MRRFTSGMLAALMDNSRKPRPSSSPVMRGSPAISPQMLTGMRALSAASAVSWINRRTAGCIGL